MNIKLAESLLIILILTACAKAPAGKSLSEEPQMVGNDRDTNGCIASAGYMWCAKTAQCERPWELAQQKGFALTENNFAEFCKKPD